MGSRYQALQRLGLPDGHCRGDLHSYRADLAFRSTKDKKPAIGVVIAGIIIPILFLVTGQKPVERPNPFHPDNVDLGPDLGLPPPGSEIGPGGPGLSPLPPGTDDSPSLLPPGNPEN